MTDLLEILRSAGVEVKEEGNWRTRKRPGVFRPVGLFIHHTGGHNDLGTVRDGRGGANPLAGPLSNLWVPQVGPVHLISDGRCNHAGDGSRKVLDDVLKDLAPRGDAVTLGLRDDTTGNAWFYGFECENRGDGADFWTPHQLNQMIKAAAAICRWKGWSANRVIGHREWTRRKPDPKGFSMNWFRSEVAFLLKGAVVPTPGQENAMLKVQNGRGFCILANDDLVITDKDGAIFHFDADGVQDNIEYVSAYNAHPELDDSPGPDGRECLGVYAIGLDGKARPNGHPEALGYCQVFNDSARYRWVKKP